MKKNVYLPIKFGGVLHQKGGRHERQTDNSSENSDYKFQRLYSECQWLSGYHSRRASRSAEFKGALEHCELVGFYNTALQHFTNYRKFKCLSDIFCQFCDQGFENNIFLPIVSAQKAVKAA